MKKIILLFLCLPTLVFAQVGIGTSTPNSSAKLEIAATNQGFLPPRISLTATTDASTIGTPATGLLVYNTASAGSGATAVTPGYYYFNGTAWARLIVPTDESFFVTLNTTQTVAGNKTFSNDLVVNNLSIGRGTGSGNYIYNSAVGVATLGNNTSGWGNTGVGYHSLKANTTGMGNSAFGFQGQMSGTTGSQNTSFGFASLIDNITGSGNTSIGYQALQKNIGSNNIAIGSNAMYLAQNATGNIILGNSVLQNATSPSGNVVIGMAAGSTNFTNESNNTLIGYGTQLGATGITNATALGNGATVSASNTIQLGNNSITSVKTEGKLTSGTVTYPNNDGSNGQVIQTNGSGQLTWTTPPTVSGTSNYISKFTGTSSVGNSLIFDDGSSIGIGTTSPSSKAVLDLTSTTKGLLLPRLTESQRNAITSPAEGLLIYNSTSGSAEIYGKTKRVERVDLSYFSGTWSTGADYAWQSFSPTVSGFISKIILRQLNPRQDPSTNSFEYQVTIYSGVSGTNGGSLSGGTIIGQTSVIVPAVAAPAPWLDVEYVFSNSPYAQQGTTYYFQVREVSTGAYYGGIQMNSTDVYTSYNSWVGGFNQDLNFKIFIRPQGSASWISLN